MNGKGYLIKGNGRKLEWDWRMDKVKRDGKGRKSRNNDEENN